MKLDVKRTVLVGFAFFSICAFWQMYNSVLPLMLTQTFHMNETLSGVLMSMDNVLSLVLLPLFGGISDRCRSRLGRRRPFILIGTLLAVVLMQFLPLLDNRYAQHPTLRTLLLFLLALGALLVAMSIYRSPAVALMPDVTPKPLRSRANAVINLMGAAGGILYLLAAAGLYSGDGADAAHTDYAPLFFLVGGVMLLSMLVVLCTVPERRIEAEQLPAGTPDTPEADPGAPAAREVLPRPVRRSLAALLCSIALWFMGYNAVETWFTAYASHVWGMALGDAAVCLTVATGGAIVSYLPVGALSARIGRKKTILCGAALLSACFFAAYGYARISSAFSPLLYGLFALIGLAWAAINVNSLPMVVEICHRQDVGRFTGYYYAFSMAAQIVTPIAAGALLKNVSYAALFPYAAGLVGASFLTMLLVRHGDSREIQQGVDLFNGEG